jgi:hypothetical protein
MLGLPRVCSCCTGICVHKAHERDRGATDGEGRPEVPAVSGGADGSGSPNYDVLLPTSGARYVTAHHSQTGEMLLRGSGGDENGHLPLEARISSCPAPAIF